MAEILDCVAEIFSSRFVTKFVILVLKEAIFVDIAKKLSVNLKSYREEKELPQSACAQELGIAKATLQKLEKGDPVSSQTIQHVINRMGMELVLRPKEQRAEEVTVDGLIAAFLDGLQYCDLTDSQQRGLEEIMRGIRSFLETSN
jgi:DNA-binding XRE family transcriptional regulator